MCSIHGECCLSYKRSILLSNIKICSMCKEKEEKEEKEE